MQKNSLSVVPRDVMLDDLGNAQFLGGYMQSSQLQDAEMHPYQVTGDLPFGVGPIQDSIPFGFLGADEIEGFNNYVGDCQSFEAAEGAHEHFLGDLLNVVGGAHEHISGGCELLNVVGGAHEHVSGGCESLNVVGGAHEQVLGNCVPLKAAGGAHDHFNAGIAVENVSGQETKLSDKMLKILISAVSYLGEVHSSPYTTKSDWEAISEVIAQRGYTVIPQQCQDMFNDLKYNYERFCAILGTDACDVYENPILLESMYLPDEAKVEVRNLIYSKQLFFQEMCSCLNGNLTCVPLDFPLIRSLACALKSKLLPRSEMPTQGTSGKRKRLLEDRRGKSPVAPSNANASSGEGSKMSEERLLQLQELKARLLAKQLEFEKEKLEWLKHNQNIEWEMQKMRLRNEVLKLENARLALQLQTQFIVRD